jgi:ankyrin repeat protein
MAPEFFPFIVFAGLGVIALVGVCVGIPFLLFAYRKKHLRLPAAFVLSAVAFVVIALLALGSLIWQQFFLNEPLVTACGQGDLETAQRLLAQGASPDAYGIDFVETALIAASRGGHRDIVKLLLSKGATVDLKDSQGKTSLDRAHEGGCADIVLLLQLANNPP